jgi:hypothetical protein
MFIDGSPVGKPISSSASTLFSDPKQAPFAMKPDITFKSCHPNDFKFNSKISVQVSATVFKTSFQFRISIYGIRVAGDGWVTNENHLEDLNRRLPTVATLAFCYDLDRGA